MTSLPEPTPASGKPAEQAPVPPPKPTSWLQYLYFLRFSVAAWCLLPLLCGLDLWHVTSNLTRAIMTLDSSWQVFNATFFIVAMGMVVLITARNTARNGERRFESACPRWAYDALTDHGSRGLGWTLVVAHVPTIVTLIYLGHTALSEGESYHVWPLGTHWWNICFLDLLGIMAALAFWYVVSLFYYWTYRSGPANREAAALIFPERWFGETRRAVPPPRLTHWIEVLTEKLLSVTAYEGYADSPDGPLWELHFLSTIALVGIFVVYLLLYPVTAPALLRFTDKWWIAVAFLVTLVFEYSIWNAGALAEDGSDSKWAAGVKLWFQWSPVAVLAGYLAIVIWDLVHGTVRFEMGFPTLASLLVLANFFVWLFAGAAFFFDRFRIPVITAVLMFVFLPKWIAPYAAEFCDWIHFPWGAEHLDLEHYYTVATRPQLVLPLPTPGDLMEKRVQNAEEPYIIVTASGGGIRAAEWTAQLMAHMEKRFAYDRQLRSKGYTFHDHLLLASGVSGGSVGLMPYLLEYTADPAQWFPNRDGLQLRMTSAPACSDLEAVAWGLNYYDLYRLLLTVRLPVPSGLSAGGNDPDRTWALTTAMNRNLTDVRHCVSKEERAKLEGLPAIKDGAEMTLGDAAEQAGAGKFPAFTFNTTAAETGGRFLLSDYWVPAPAPDVIPADSFLQVYQQANAQGQYPDLPLATAARLSATFPIVSSATRIPAEFAKHAYHFVDGGYYDNDGTASAIEFIKSGLDSSTLGRGKDGRLKIVLFEIRDDDGSTVRDENSFTSQNQNTDDKRSWTQINQLTAPLSGMWAAGHESISMRNRRELCILEQAYQDRLDIHHVVFTIKNDPDQLSPLSWNLTIAQRDMITDRVRGTKGDRETNQWIDGAIHWIADHGVVEAGTGDSGEVCQALVEPGTSTTTVATH
jgi:hypothetical protein